MVVRQRVAMNAESVTFVASARVVAQRLLADLPERLEHSHRVAVRAAVLCPAVAANKEHLLIAAAWVHDIGYAPTVRDSGFTLWAGRTISSVTATRRSCRAGGPPFRCPVRRRRPRPIR